jgi:hypothetical protein
MGKHNAKLSLWKRRSLYKYNEDWTGCLSWRQLEHWQHCGVVLCRFELCAHGYGPQYRLSLLHEALNLNIRLSKAGESPAFSRTCLRAKLEKKYWGKKNLESGA